MTGVSHDLPFKNLFYQIITDFPFITNIPFSQTYPKLRLYVYMCCIYT
jgi:hypothetical protein